MSTSMHVCNPYCGACKPPKEALLICPSCGEGNDPGSGEFGNCKACGAKLPPRQIPKPIMCLKINQMCANPCGLGSKAPRVVVKACVHHTPLAT